MMIFNINGQNTTGTSTRKYAGYLWVEKIQEMGLSLIVPWQQVSESKERRVPKPSK
jgi:hypothetical protein